MTNQPLCGGEGRADSLVDCSGELFQRRVRNEGGHDAGRRKLLSAPVWRVMMSPGWCQPHKASALTSSPASSPPSDFLTLAVLLAQNPFPLICGCFVVVVILVRSPSFFSFPFCLQSSLFSGFLFFSPVSAASCCLLPLPPPFGPSPLDRVPSAAVLVLGPPLTAS